MDFVKLEKQVGTGWAKLLRPFMVEDTKGECEYSKISGFLKQEKDAGTTFLPAGELVFRAFRETPIEQVRVVLLGQDPYFKAGYANGLAFGTTHADMPVSLKLIYDGIEDDLYRGLDLEKPMRDTSLVQWAHQGVLMLNSALTVRQDDAKSDEHRKTWKPFTKFLVEQLSLVKRNIIFMGIGGVAKELLSDINPFLHFVYQAEHPSFAAREKRSWTHANIFSKVNFAIELNKLGEPIKW